jgi:hypothetical protein
MYIGELGLYPSQHDDLLASPDVALANAVRTFATDCVGKVLDCVAKVCWNWDSTCSFDGPVADVVLEWKRESLSSGTTGASGPVRQGQRMDIFRNKEWVGCTTSNIFVANDIVLDSSEKASVFRIVPFVASVLRSEMASLLAFEIEVELDSISV